MPSPFQCGQTLPDAATTHYIMPMATTAYRRSEYARQPTTPVATINSIATGCGHSHQYNHVRCGVKTRQRLAAKPTPRLCYAAPANQTSPARQNTFSDTRLRPPDLRQVV